MTRTAYRALAILWSLGIIVAYSLPGSTLPAGPELLGWDKIAHFGLFAGFGFLWMRVLHPRRGTSRATVPKRMIVFLLVSLLLAVSGEVYQSLLPERTPDPYDALANALGVSAAVLLFRWRHPPTPSHSNA